MYMDATIPEKTTVDIINSTIGHFTRREEDECAEVELILQWNGAAAYHAILEEMVDALGPDAREGRPFSEAAGPTGNDQGLLGRYFAKLIEMFLGPRF